MNRLQSAMHDAPVKTPESRQYDRRARRQPANRIQCKGLRGSRGVRFCAGWPSGRAPPPSAVCSKRPTTTELQPGPTPRPPAPTGQEPRPTADRPRSRVAPCVEKWTPARARPVTIFRARGFYAIGQARLPAGSGPRSRASSSSDMKCRSSTGRTPRLAKKPATRSPVRTYIVTLYACAAGIPRSIWYSRM